MDPGAKEAYDSLESDPLVDVNAYKLGTGGGGPPGQTVPFSSSINTDAVDRYDWDQHKQNMDYSTARWKKTTTVGREIKKDADGNNVNPGPGGPYLPQAVEMPRDKTKGIVMHHTGGHYRNALKKAHNWAYKGKGIQYLIGRGNDGGDDGQIYKVMPDNMSGIHVGKRNQYAKDNDLRNQNLQSIEIVANDDEDVTPAQIESAIRLAKSLGYDWDQIYRHAEIRKDKSPDEGKAVIDRLRGGSSVSPKKYPKEYPYK